MRLYSFDAEGPPSRNFIVSSGEVRRLFAAMAAIADVKLISRGGLDGTGYVGYFAIPRSLSFDCWLKVPTAAFIFAFYRRLESYGIMPLSVGHQGPLPGSQA